MRGVYVLLLAIFAFSCTNPPYAGPDVVGAQDFVIDSYKIREGKIAILELEGKPQQELTPEFLEEYTDTIQDGDTLRIALFHPTRSDLVQSIDYIGQSVGYTVREGALRLPDIEPVHIEGLTISEAQELLQKEYEKEIADVEVYLSYGQRAVRKIELAGLVTTPELPVTGKTRLFEVLARARVPDNANFFKSYVVRDGSPLPIDMHRLVTEGDMSQNIVMHGGDKVYIASPAASTAMVLGEVSAKGVINLPSGMMPLRLALAQAGGLTGSADHRYIQIIRGNIVNPKIYTVTWKHVVRLPTDSLLIMPGDIVYVAATPIAEWNRFVNNLLPTISTYELLADKVKGVILP